MTTRRDRPGASGAVTIQHHSTNGETTVTDVRLITVSTHGKQYVLEWCHRSKTNGLGKIQRAILDYLATAPAGFGSIGRESKDSNRITWHGQPYGVRVPEITAAVYATEEPTASQIRVVQRNVRRLEQLDRVHCWHGTIRWSERRHTDYRGQETTGPRPVSGLYVALRWDCAHLDEQARLAAEEDARRTSEYEARMEWFKNGDPVGALHDLLH